MDLWPDPAQLFLHLHALVTDYCENWERCTLCQALKLNGSGQIQSSGIKFTGKAGLPPKEIWFFRFTTTKMVGGKAFVKNHVLKTLPREMGGAA